MTAKNKGFTLIELLVVIAIIAVLMAILMPALNIAREQARGITCMADQRNLALAYRMYADSNGGIICGGFASTGLVNGIPPWVAPPLSRAVLGSTQVTGPTITLQHRFNGIMAGALYPYNKDVKSYHCPGDNRLQRGTSLGSGAEYRIYRSYSLSDYMQGTRSNDEKNLDSFKSPSLKMLFVEEIYDGAAGHYNHDGWSYSPWSQTMWDPLGLFHNDACTFSFMDGHAERKKWEDKRTIIYFRNRLDPQAIPKGQVHNPPNPDLTWLDEHYPGLTRQKP